MRKLFFVSLFIFSTVKGFAQADTAFWFAAPDIEIVNHPVYGEYDRPIYLRLTSFTAAANVTISIPANPGFTPININIPANSTSTVNLTSWIDLIENSDPANVANKGIYIQSSTDITAYYEVNSTTCNCNPELFSLKARNAIGNEFYIPSQLTWAVDTVRHPNAKAGFDIVATQNGTTVTITPNKALIGHPANVPFSITLNKGQSYACIALYRNGTSMLNGSKVVSDKPVAVTTYEDLLFSDGACADLAGDQLVPTAIYGFEFAVVRGNLTTRDKVIVTASQNNTNIYLNGSAVAAGNINAGQSFEYDMLPATASLYITTSKAVNVFHYTGSGCEVGAAAIPKLTCTGSSSVSLVRTSNGGNASVMIVTKNGNQGSFLVNGVAGIITAGDFTPLTGTGGAYLYAKKDVTASMPLNAATTFSNTAGKFQLGFFNVTASNGGCMYGFFSDFKKSNVTNTQVETCRLDSAQLNAIGGVTYQWTPATGLSNPNISNPKASPATTTDYKVVITDGNGCVDSAFVKVIVNNCSLTCNNWLRTQAVGQSVTVGDLDITGNQVTVEANFNCSSFPLTRPDKQEDIVSKHANTTDINYVLRMDLAGITTTNGQFLTPIPCDNLVTNKTYHVAMVYNGTSLKFYRDGFLMSQVAATGNLITNNWPTTIGDYAVNNPVGTNFLGYINEVRIWNVARTQAQIRTYMDASLPNPTTQTGLQAYYTFDNLTNKQGNATWNGTLNGGATINNSNPNCTYIADSCSVTTSSVIINNYTPVLALNPCNNTLSVEDGTAYNVGDTVLLIQMKGAVIDSTNTAAFGAITDYKNSGNYEFNYVKSKTGNQIELLNSLTRQYDIPVGKVQLVRVPYYTNLTTADTLTCLPWDGSKGGVLVFNVQNTLTLNQPLDVSGKGFKGAPGYNPGNASLTCNQNSYNYPTNTLFAAQKGESITTISNNIICGKGSPAGGGGGGLGHNSGGGGGGNAGTGGFGGYQLDNCGGAPFDNRGIGGKQLLYSTALNRIFMGSGGGAGHADNPGNVPPAGGNGAGIIIVNADKLISNGKKITANGNPGLACSTASSPDCHDAMGGGGAGGSVLLSVNQYLDNSIVENKGGKGADVVSGNIAAAGRIGPGGGGAGGLAFLKAASLPANLNIVNTGGLNGVLTQSANDPWGATTGSAGQNIFNLVLPVDNVPFKPNIDSVRIKDSILSCNDFDFKGLAYINTNPITSWQWYFGDGGQATTQNTTHAYGTAGTYTVKLIVTDINGCIDSITKNVNALPAVTADAGPNVSICSNGTVSVTLNGSAVGGPYSWSPAIYLNNPNIANPVATISSTTTFYLNVIGSPTCTAVDSVIITIDPVPLVDTRPDTAICRLSPLVLNTSSNATSFQWSPAASVSNPNIASPNFIGTTSGWVYVTASFATGCFAKDSLYVTINPTPFVDTRTDTAICISSPLVLTTNSDATAFQWNPAGNVSNPTIASPDYTGTVSGWMYVTGSFASGCSVTDSLYVTVNPLPLVDTRPDTSICRAYPLVLNTSSNATNFQWSPAASVSNPNIASPNFIGTSSGWVYVTASFATGCTAKDSLYVTINPTPVVDTRTDTAICRSSPLVLTTSSDATFIQWSPAASVSNPNIASPNFVGSTSGWVYVTGSFASGCTATDSLYVTVNPIPLVDTRTDTTICRSSPLVLNTNSNATIFQWTPVADVSNSTIANPNYIGNTSGWVYITGSTAAGCFAKDSLYVTVNQLPVVQSIADSTICLGQSISLTTTGALTYSWTPAIGLSNPNIASPVFSGNSGQNYTVTGTDANGCKNTDLIAITVITPPAFKAPPEFTICEKKSVTLDGNNDPAFSYLWSPATYLSNANIRNPVANPPQTTLYTLLVSEKRCGFNSTFTSLLTVVPAPFINARKSNDIDCAFRSATLFASGGNQYLWSPSTGLSNINIANPVATPANDQTYTVLVTNSTGCTNTDTVTVFNKRASSLARYMPNAFTPDGNGLNDCYGLKNWMYIQKLQFFIFNRYGEQVFATSNPNVCWNGTYKGKPALAGTYVYVIKAQTDCGEEEQKGSFLLVR